MKLIIKRRKIGSTGTHSTIETSMQACVNIYKRKFENLRNRKRFFVNQTTVSHSQFNRHVSCEWIQKLRYWEFEEEFNVLEQKRGTFQIMSDWNVRFLLIWCCGFVWMKLGLRFCTPEYKRTYCELYYSQFLNFPLTL